MRHFSLLALSAIVLLVSAAQAREIEELRNRVRDGIQRTDKDVGNIIHRDKLTTPQREKFDAAVEDLGKIREKLTSSEWEKERARFEKAVDNLDFVVKNATLSDDDRQMLGIDVYTLQVILDSWKPEHP